MRKNSRTCVFNFQNVFPRLYRGIPLNGRDPRKGRGGINGREKNDRNGKERKGDKGEGNGRREEK